MSGWHYVALDLDEDEDGPVFISAAADRGIAAAEALLKKHAEFHAYLKETGRQ